MSKNISNLSGRIGLKNNLFQKISERSLKSKNDSGMKEIANEYPDTIAMRYKELGIWNETRQ